MQNLTKCSNRHYVALKRIYRFFDKYGRSTNSTAYLNLRVSNWSSNEVRSLTIPASYHTLQASWLENRLDARCLLSKEWGSVRYFSRKSMNSRDKSKSSKESQDDPDDKKSDENKESFNMIIQKAFYAIFGFFVLYSALKIPSSKQELEMFGFISWHEFVHHMLTKGEVEEIVINPELRKVYILLHDGAIIKGKRSQYKKYVMNIPSSEEFEEKVRKVESNLGIKPGDGVQIIYERTSPSVPILLYALILAAIVMTIFSWGKKIKFPKPWEFLTHMKRAKFTLVDPLTGHGKGVRFKDVAGLKEAKIEIMEFVDYLKHPERYETLGAKIPKGALLLGPPGCGKTLLAKAIATEANVPFLSMNGSEFIELLGGLGPARVRNLFEEGKKRAPSIIYIDEIDAIGKRRSTSSVPMANDETERTLNQLLVEMDGMMSRADVLILASTNRAEVLDKALLRPGRFDRHILIDLPTLEERKQIFDYHLEKLSLQDKPTKYSGYLAYLTPGFSGADIANVCNESALHAATEKKKAVDGSDLMYAIDRTIGGTQKKTNTLTPSMKRVVAYHESGHALVGWLLKHTDALLKVTIVPRTNLKLGFSQYTPSNQKLYSKEELFEKMCMMLGGRAAESFMFNQISSGAADDLEKVTKLAYLQIQQYGMCPTIGLMSYDEESLTTKTKKMYSKKLANLMDVEARRLIAEAYKSTNKLIFDNKDKLEKLAEALLEKETLSYAEVEELIGPPPFGKKRLIEPMEFETSVPLTEPQQPAQEAPM